MARVPLPLEHIEPIRNELHEPMKQHNAVHVIQQHDGEILFETRIGAGVNYHEHPGAMITCIIPRPMNAIFVRVYNDVDPDAAMFYRDSNAFTPELWNDVPFYPVFNNIVATDTNDHDSDHINNSWEITLGLDPYNMDSDQDGVPDHMEILSGTDPLDANSVVPEFTVRFVTHDEIMVNWDHVPMQYPPELIQSIMESSGVTNDAYHDHTYHVQQTDSLLHDWYNMHSGPVHEWPKHINIPPSTNVVWFYRVIMMP